MPLPGTDPTGILSAKAIAAGESFRTLGFANAALIAAQGVAEIAGARQAGGSMSSGTYQVNELTRFGGMPEIYSAGGADYVTVPQGQSGHTTPVRKMGSNDGGINVNIENYGTPQNYDVQQISPTDVRIIARDEAKKEIVAQSSSRSSPLNRTQDNMYKREKKL